MAYVAPTPATLKLRYPAFAAVADEAVEYWLTDARLIVTDGWIEADRAPAEMSLAAHNMARQGLGSDATGVGGMAAKGVTDFKSASFSVSLDASAAKAAAAGGYGSTSYGQEFRVFLRRNAGGPRLVGCVEPLGGAAFGYGVFGSGSW